APASIRIRSSFKRMGANMRRLALLCSAFAFLCAVGATDAQMQAAPAKHSASKANAATATPPPDRRPRYKRDDTPATVVAAPATPAVATKKRAARRSPADAQPPTAQAGRATTRDAAACAQVREHDAAIAGCTRIIEDARQKPKGRAAAYYNRGNAYAAKGDHAAAIADYDEAIRLEPKSALAFNNRGTAHSG